MLKVSVAFLVIGFSLVANAAKKDEPKECPGPIKGSVVDVLTTSGDCPNQLVDLMTAYADHYLDFGRCHVSYSDSGDKCTMLWDSSCDGLTWPETGDKIYTMSYMAVTWDEAKEEYRGEITTHVFRAEDESKVCWAKGKIKIEK